MRSVDVPSFFPPNRTFCGVGLLSHGWHRSNLVENEKLILTNAVYYHRLVYLETVFLLNPIDIRCSLARSSSGRRSTLSDQSLYQTFHHLHMAVYDSW